MHTEVKGAKHLIPFLSYDDNGAAKLMGLLWGLNGWLQEDTLNVAHRNVKDMWAEIINLLPGNKIHFKAN